MKRIPLFLAALITSLLVVMAVAPATAQTRDTPYWATIRVDELNMRVGPSQDYRIDWVYRRQGLPVRVVRVMEGWRLIQDPDGAQGWVVARLLSPERGAIVVGEGLAAVRAEPSATSALKWNAEPGAVAGLGKCEAGWCEVDFSGREGWVEQVRLWGAGDP